jgi:hypothetical protein
MTAIPGPEFSANPGRQYFMAAPTARLVPPRPKIEAIVPIFCHSGVTGRRVGESNRGGMNCADMNAGQLELLSLCRFASSALSKMCGASPRFSSASPSLMRRKPDVV